MAQIRQVSRGWSRMVSRFAVHLLGLRRPLFRRSERLAALSGRIGLRPLPFGQPLVRKATMAPPGNLRRMFHDRSALVAFSRAIEQSSVASRCF